MTCIPTLEREEREEEIFPAKAQRFGIRNHTYEQALQYLNMSPPNPFKHLSNNIEGEVFTDLVSRQLYATDASVYQQLPDAIARPKNTQDCIKIVQFAQQHQIPLIPRAAGTSVAGQVVGKGLVVDISRHMGKILAQNKDQIRVQPGVILDDLNQHLLPQNLKFAQDISTSNRCMIAGMIGNNACGAHSHIYGTTRDHVIALEMVLSDASLVTFGPLSPEQLKAKLAQEDLEGHIYRTLHRLIQQHREMILAHYPKPEIIRRNTGYALDYLAQMPPHQDEKAFNLAPFLCGSEGTLGLITQAELKLIPRVQHKILVAVHFSSLIESMQAMKRIMQHQPAAVELFDQHILTSALHNTQQASNRDWIEGNPEAVLVVEFFAQNQTELNQICQNLVTDLRHHKIGYAYPIIRDQAMSQVWGLRKAALGLLMGTPSAQKAVAVIEDSAVAIADLAEYVRQVQQLMAERNLSCVYYGHAAAGLLHLRPFLNLHHPQDRQIFIQLSEEIARLIIKFNGTLSGEHGDGRLRSPYIKKILGEKVYQLLEEVKSCFDPKNIFNPHKIVAALPIEQNWRFNQQSPIPLKTGFKWKNEGGFAAAIEKCNGAAACRKSLGTGNMCPSFLATREEYYSTRGRANLLRQQLYADTGPFASTELKTSLDLCLACKACKNECPASIDMAKLKAEFLYQYYQQHGFPLRTRILGYYAKLLKLGGYVPSLANYLLKTNWLKKRLGIAPSRQLPLITSHPLSHWCLKRKKPACNQNTPLKWVGLWCDIYTQYHQPHVGQAAIELFNRLGYRVIPIILENSPRLLISLGLLKQAKQSLSKLLKGHLSALEAGAEFPIIGLEPSEALVFRDEALDLLSQREADKMKEIAHRTRLFEEFILDEINHQKIHQDLFQYVQQDYLLHVHCHQKSLSSAQTSLQVLNFLPGVKASLIQSGCCGMAGTFGYEHPDLSHKIGEMQLFPALRQASETTLTVATGMACRQQIKQAMGIAALHPVEVFRNHLNL